MKIGAFKSLYNKIGSFGSFGRSFNQDFGPGRINNKARNNTLARTTAQLISTLDFSQTTQINTAILNILNIRARLEKTATPISRTLQDFAAEQKSKDTTNVFKSTTRGSKIDSNA